MAEIKKQKKIKVLESEIDAVRQLPDVYIGALGNHGYLNMYREILQNSLDEIIKGNTLDKNIIVSYDARNHVCIIEDNGQGIQLDMLAKVFSVLHSSSNYDKEEGSGDYSSGKNGMGATITNFLCRFFNVESYRMDGTAAKVEFIEGELSKESIIKKPTKAHGLITTFAPSEMMGDITVSDVEIENLTWLIAHLCKPGTKITFNAIDFAGNKHKSIIENKNGIIDILNKICEKNLIEPVYFAHDNGTMKIEALLTYDIADMDGLGVKAFANMCPCDAGTHIDGVIDAIVKYFRDYMNKIYLANNKKKLTVKAEDIRTGLRIVVSSFHIKPLFTGQSKEVFSKEDMKPFAYEQTLKALENWATVKPSDLQRVCKYLKEVCEIRSKQDNEKVKMSDKYTQSAVTGYPAKYKKPNGKKNIEVIICEGDSAAAGMENNRDKKTQGIFPIRGKMLNPFTTPAKRYFENEEVGGLFKIFGYNGYSKKFDPDKFIPEKVIIAADADADGAHITCLCLGLFLRYLPFAIEQGKIFKASPPLYGAEIGKNKYKFFADNVEYIQYVQDLFCKNNSIYSEKNKPYSKKDITQILYKNMYYADELERVANTYSINPYLLEFLLYNKDLPYNKFKSAIEKTYKFIKVDKLNNTIMVEGLVDSKIQTVFFNDRLLADCIEIVNLINRAENYYIINNEKYSIYGLMKLFNTFEPKHISRYKGLGEMPPALLGTSTVLPNQGRTLKQYTIADAKKELKTITEMQNDKSAFIKGIKIRKEDIV